MRAAGILSRGSTWTTTFC